MVLSLLEITNKRLRLETVELLLSLKWAEWQQVYSDDVKKSGVAVTIMPNSNEERVWNDLKALRDERNKLLMDLRGSGQKI